MPSSHWSPKRGFKINATKCYMLLRKACNLSEVCSVVNKRIYWIYKEGGNIIKVKWAVPRTTQRSAAPSNGHCNVQNGTIGTSGESSETHAACTRCGWRPAMSCKFINVSICNWKRFCMNWAKMRKETRSANWSIYYHNWDVAEDSPFTRVTSHIITIIIYFWPFAECSIMNRLFFNLFR